MWNKNIPAIPAAINEPVLSLAVLAIYKALVTSITYIITIAPDTIKPISSLITEKIKSVVLGYKNPSCVWFPFNTPIPTNPPAPIASFD